MFGHGVCWFTFAARFPTPKSHHCPPQVSEYVQTAKAMSRTPCHDSISVKKTKRRRPRQSTDYVFA